MKTKKLSAGNDLKHDKNPVVSPQIPYNFLATSTSQRVLETQARAWVAIDSKLSQIEALNSDAFVRIQVSNLVRTAKYWRKKLQDIHTK